MQRAPTTGHGSITEELRLLERLCGTTDVKGTKDMREIGVREQTRAIAMLAALKMIDAALQACMMGEGPAVSAVRAAIELAESRA